MPDPEERMINAPVRGMGPLSLLGKVLSFLVGGTAVVAYLYFGISTINIDDLFSRRGADVTGHEGTPLPVVDADSETVEQLLERLCIRGSPDYVSECRLLRQRLCNQPALEAAMRKLGDRNDHLSSAKLGTAFLDRCDEDERIGLFATQDCYRVTDFATALNTIDRFPSQVSSYPQFASWRGFILEKLERFEEAARDFERALYLFVDLSEVGAMQFYYVTRTLKAAGRYCDAISPLQLFVGFDPANRLSTQIEQEIRVLRGQGNCEPDTAPNRQSIPLSRDDGLLLVDAMINGVNGTFILDTGASIVHITREFAEEADIGLSEDHRIIVRGVTGSRRDYLGEIAQLAIEGFVARNVIATIASVEDSLEPGIDGLLGQTFLGRFRYSIDSDRLTLSPIW